jgi:TolB protein
MKPNRFTWPAAALLAAACSTSSVKTDAPAEDLAQSEQGLELKVKELFGQDARVGRVFGTGSRLLVGVALEPQVEESDVPVPLAVARLEKAELTVVAEDALYKEARLIGDSVALVTTDGALSLRGTDGVERVLAEGVKGELSAAPNGGLLFTADDETGAGDTAVVLADRAGELHVLADSLEAADDRSSVSPDGQTVVFVSGRTGIASLFRTSLEGGDAVQLTNVGLVRPDAPELIGDDVESSNDEAPASFVPPPVSAEALSWLSADTLRYDAGGGELWTVNVRTGVATREGGAP